MLTVLRIGFFDGSTRIDAFAKGNKTAEFGADYREEQVDANQVRDAHGKERGIGEIGSIVHRGCGANDNDQAENHLVDPGGDRFFAKEVLPCLEAVVAPGDQGGKREKENAEE